MDKAPGLKIIIVLFIIFIISIILYLSWYYKVEKITTQKLENIQDSFFQEGIEFTWELENNTGFPYRIEKELRNINIKFNSINISTENFKIIYQPWNIHHIIFKISNNINIFNNNKKITVTNSNLLASFTINKYLQKKISISSSNIGFHTNKSIYDFNKLGLHFKTNDNDDLQFALRIDELSVPPLFLEKNTLNKLYITGDVIKYKKIDINNYYKWLSNEGGININNINIDINETNIAGNAFLRLDKNLDIQSSISIYSNNFNDIFTLLEQNNMVSKNTLIKANLIIKAIEIASKTSNKQSIFSINIRNGYLFLMGIKLLEIPNIREYLWINPVPQR
ncbi:MAG: DUF2125 domain-containing protein [Pelagibacterales bacterium]|nr:DUF2125 domain-containing protein [Pelagibacterales bacterium]